MPTSQNLNNHHQVFSLKSFYPYQASTLAKSLLGAMMGVSITAAFKRSGVEIAVAGMTGAATGAFLSRISEGLSSHAGLSKHDVDTLTIDWKQAKRLKHSQNGKVGVSFISFNDDSRIVVKPTYHPEIEFFLLKLGEKLGFKLPMARLSDTREHAGISRCALNSRLNKDPREKVKELYQHRPPESPFLIMESLEGDTLKDVSENHPAQLQSNRLFVQMGELFAFDLLLNNFDRMPNPWMNYCGNLENIHVTDNELFLLDSSMDVNPVHGHQHYLSLIRMIVGELVEGTRASQSFVKDICQRLGVEYSTDLYHAFREGFLEKRQRVANHLTAEVLNEMRLTIFKASSNDSPVDSLELTNFIVSNALALSDETSSIIG